MGVQGLWELLSPVGRPVTLESLENKILGIDVSIWLNQALKGCRNKDGQTSQNAHLITIFHRICKLLFYRIKPIIVFDGHPPELKKQTLLERQKQRDQAQKSKKLSHYVLKKYLMEQLKNGKSNHCNEKPVNEEGSAIYSSENVKNNRSETDDDDDELENYRFDYTRTFQDPFCINFETDEFKMLPLDVQHELLNDIKESYKRKCWLQQDELPKDSDEFSKYQVAQLLNKRKIQQKLEDIQKTMSHRSIANIKEMHLSYIDLEEDEITEERPIISEEHSHFIFFKQSKVTAGNELKNADPNKDKNCKNATEAVNISNETVKNDLVQSPEDSKSSKVFIIKDDNYESSSKEINIEYLDLCENEFQKEEEILEISNRSKENETKFNSEHIKLYEKKKTFNSKGLNYDDDAHRSLEKDILKEIKITETKDQLNNQNHDRLAINAITIQEESNNSNCQLVESCPLSFNSFKKKENVDDTICLHNNLIKKNVIKNSSQNENLHEEINVSYKQNQDNCHKTESIENTSIVDIKQKINEQAAIITIDLAEPPIINDDLFPASIFNKPANIIDKQPDDKWKISINTNLEELEADVKLLKAEQQDQYRKTLTISEYMYQETKELLTLFGIPYVNSPTEAEAQCAQLELLSLTNGTITDDSDIWLFGGQKVYKNFFVQKKHVEFFKNTDIKSHFNMDRDKLIAFAMLTGSDYTQGIHGVGPITAMEILSEFPGNCMESLKNFRKWWEGFQQQKELPKNSTLVKLQKLELDDGFPSKVVYDAYINPCVDCSTETFSWSHPDLDCLREFAQEKFGWNLKKIDEILLPVMKKINENQVQTKIDGYFTTHLTKEENLFPSKRLQKAVKKMLPEKTDSCKQSKKKRKVQMKTGKRHKQQFMESCTNNTKFNLSEESSSD